MKMTTDIKQLISVIQDIKSGNQFHKYIDFIRFPFYRNVEVDTQINFDFPLTVFIGQNGCGKSSCLHAMYGAPMNYTPYSFWFDTKVDPITYYDEQRKRHSFWYSYKDQQGNIKEVIKARIKRNNDPNYWETSRPLVWAGMVSRQTRDTPIEKEVVYLDFRAELSAFDKYFYFGNTRNLSSRNKQEFIRRKSASLNNLLSGKKATIKTKAGPVNKPIRHISEEELEWISFILGKKYDSGEYLEHKLYRNNGYSVVFRTSFGNYSEAFAGSGEVATVRLVLKILDAVAYSLILLDEPEVSLHPGAQSRLKLFLLEQIKLKKHQIIITSHSPSIVNGLPKEAIKVFFQKPSNGRFLINENLSPEEAFYHIEYPNENRKNIIVEDILGQRVVEGVLSKMGAATKSLFNVKYNPGGESVIKKEFATVFCREENSNDYIFFDGDQKPNNPHQDWRSFPATDLTIRYLQDEIKRQTNEEIKFSVDGGVTGSNAHQQVLLLKQYLDYFLSNVHYLPRNTPEEIIWDSEKAELQIRLSLSDRTEADRSINKINSLISYKKKYSILSQILYGESNAESISAVHKLFLRYWLEEANQDYKSVCKSLQLVVDRN